MPIPGTDILTTAELAGQMLRESRSDTLRASDRARRAEVECERLREMLSIARNGLRAAIGEIHDVASMPVDIDAFEHALRRSDPDASTEDVTP